MCDICWEGAGRREREEGGGVQFLKKNFKGNSYRILIGISHGSVEKIFKKNDFSFIVLRVLKLFFTHDALLFPHRLTDYWSYVVRQTAVSANLF